MTHTKCKVMNHVVEFAVIPTSGYISVGIDGWLVGCYQSDAEAIAEALERIRLSDGLSKRPLLPGRVRKNLREMVMARSN